MSDIAQDESPTGTPLPASDEFAQRTPPTPPSPDDFDGSDVKSSRKREREVSQEPATPKTDELSVEDLKERRTHVTKKNRVKLGPTAEEDETPPNSPEKAVVELATSPPHETKVRQISRKVRGLHWEDNSGQSSQQEGMEAADSEEPVVDEQKGDHASMEAEGSAPTPGLTQEPIVIEKDVHDDADTLQHTSEDIEIPAEENTAAKQLSAVDSDSDDSENRLKRKLGVPSTSTDVPNASEPVKRPRDDNEDDNPRERKRPSPPPEQKSEDIEAKPIPEPEAPATKGGGFLSYAGVASPFARAKGPAVFGLKSTPFAAASASASSSTSGSASISSSSTNTGLPEKDASSTVISPSAPIPTKPLTSGFASFASSGFSSSPPTGVKRTGFEAFASSSPFSAVNRSKSPTGFFRGAGSSSLGSGFNRSKSPSRRGGASNAFKSYAHSGTAFGGSSSTPPVKKLRAGQGSESDAVEEENDKGLFGKGSASTSVLDEASPEGSEEDEDKQSETVFGNGDEDYGVLAEKDANASSYIEKQVVTGEEEEVTIFQVRGKLYHLGEGNTWTERGTGLVKLNIREVDGGGARLIMRKEAVYNLLLNVRLFKGMQCSFAQDPRYVRFACFENGKLAHYNIRVANAKFASELLEEIQSHMPSEHSEEIA